MEDRSTFYRQSPQADRRSPAMTLAAVVMSIIAMSTMCCAYVSVVCGVLGILFALLSRGGETKMSPNAKTAMGISILAIVMTVMLTASSFLYIISQFGSVENFWKAYLKMAESLAAQP